MSYLYVPQTVIKKKNLHQMAEGKDEKPTNPNKQLKVTVIPQMMNQ